MTENRMALEELFGKADLEALLREGVTWVLERLMELEVEARVGAGRHERCPERVTWRNGYRARPLETRL